MAGVIEQPVLAPGDPGELVHGLLDDARRAVVIRIARFPRLKENIGILGRAANAGPVRGQAVVAKGLDGQGVLVHQLAQLVVRHHADFGHFMRGAETVKEMQERHARLEGGGVADAGQVLRLLHGTGGKQGEAGLPAGHHVGMVAENGEGVRGQGAGGNMHAEGEQFAGDFVHVGDHQEQALRGGEGGAHRADLQHPVQRPGGAGFRLHFDQPRHGAIDVGPARRRPLVAPFGHGRGGGDRVDGDGFGQTIGDGGRGLVSVQRDEGGGG